MASVDDRIVRMEFDNASFERKIASTLTSLGQLDKALKFTGATQGLSDVSAAADKVHFGSMSDGIENISKKFLALSTVAITVLSNITSQALQAGTQFIKSFTITPILDGFHEFETNMNSIQTILANTASKGTTLTQVTDALNLLNVYSDKTIYNFGQMAKNIGTFTAAGVDLQTSVDSIKGIANLAAMSGSNADQASSAMYQLSQAIASGSLKLMDWNSVVNAGMGGEAFKSALFETGKAMGTLLDVPVDQTLKQWEDSGHSFRDSLQDGWITADVLTTTLQGFTGDMTKEMLLQKGFNDQQADAIMRTAEIAKAAATEVKTFTQLIGTVKEAVGTGFADSFRIIIGNFDESKKLFTDINNAIGTFVNKTADARNAILQGWKDMGGRTMLIDALTTAFHNFGEILAPIKQAFKDIFPPITADTLMRITEAIRDFANALKPTEETVSKIHSIFSGLFSALSIGWTIIKEGTKFVFNLAKSLLGLVTPEATSFLAKLGDGLTGLQASLVKGGKIKEFFEDLTDAVKKPIEFLKKIKDAIGSVFDLFDGGTADKVTGSLDNVSDAFGRMRDAIGERIGNIWKPLQDALEKVVDVLDRIWEPIKTWFQELGQKIADVMHKGDFNAVLDAINTGLLASIALLLSRFLKNGFKFDIGGGFLDKLAGSFEQLTGVLKNMQLNLKANALLKIAGAIAILAAALLVLSLIDSEALTKALIAMSVGFAQLMGSFALFTKLVTGPKTAASFTIMSAGLILLAGAMFLLALAAKLMSTMDWDELARGLTGVGGGLILMVGASKILTKNAPGMITAGLGLIAMAGALVILALAMKIFATMEWGEIAKGLVGVAGGLTAMTVAMNLMPKGIAMVKMGVGLIGVAVAMGILAVSMKIFATMDWEEIAKGMVGVGGGLVIIAGAMHLMPSNMLATSAALLLVGIALIAIAGAMKLMAGMSWEEMGKGLTGIAASLLILAGAMFLMTGALPGAAALLIISASLVVLAGVLKTLSSMSWEDIAKGLITIAAAMAIVAGMSALLSEAIPFIAAFGVSLLILGAGFALIGAGVFLVAKAFETFVKISKEAAEALPVFLEVLAKSVGAFVKGLAEGVIGAIKPLIKAAPLFAKLVGVLPRTPY
jgi:tape measure domain-containing protein